DLASSLVALADLRRVDLPPALRQRVDGAVATEGGQAPAQAWEGFIAGKATTEAALAGAVAADLTGFGDLRDLTVEAGNFISGDAVDEVKVALAAIGLTLTGATVMTLGSAAPAKVGASTVKAAHRLGRISAPLRRQLGQAARVAEAADAIETRRAIERQLVLHPQHAGARVQRRRVLGARRAEERRL
ncbi:MAG: hypothetical protein JNG88_19610, partial [Phycisphaerales bacterium]|nr:hypothetical protein [Phycisphaerales bacterium]